MLHRAQRVYSVLPDGLAMDGSSCRVAIAVRATANIHQTCPIHPSTVTQIRPEADLSPFDRRCSRRTNSHGCGPRFADQFFGDQGGLGVIGQELQGERGGLCEVPRGEWHTGTSEAHFSSYIGSLT